MRFLLTFRELGLAITDADTMGGVTWKREINSGDDFSYGTAAMAEVKFAMLADALPSGTVLDDQEFSLYISQVESGDAVWEDYGIFTVKTVVKSGHKLEITAYDNMYKFDIVVDDWLSSLAFPINVADMVYSLCDYCGVEYIQFMFSYDIEENFAVSGITGRQVLAFAAEMTATYASISSTARGKLTLRNLSGSGVTVDRSMYRTAKIAEYTVQPADKVQIRTSENDIGVVYGTGDNAYIVENNPLLYTSSAALLNPVAIGLYNQLSSVTYTPATVELFRDYGIDTGDYYTINGVKSLVMSKTMKSGGVTLTCSGNPRRSQTVSGGSYELMMLRGRSNVLERTLEKTLSRITDAEGSISILEQTATSLTAQIEDAEGNISTLEQTVKGFETRITNAEGDAADALATAETLEFRVTTAEGNISTVSQTANKINWLVKSGTSSSNFTLTDRAISLVAENIDLTGYVTFSALSTAGQTTINGSNITTGSIDADLITTGTLNADIIGANNGIYTKFSHPLETTQVSGLKSLYFGAYKYISEESTSATSPLVFYSYNGWKFLNTHPKVVISNTTYDLISTYNIASYVTFQ